jgi:hypothetical protein
MIGAWGWGGPPPVWDPDPVSRPMSRQPVLWPWLLFLLVSTGVAGGILWEVGPHLPSLPGVEARPSEPASPSAINERRRVRLFFPALTQFALREQERDIPRGALLTDDVRIILHELTTGGEPGARPPLPSGTELRQVFLDAFGILYLDFTQPIHALVGDFGPQAELAILAIVDTLTTSFSEVKRVQFLSHGEESAITLGPLDLRRPVTPELPSEASPPAVPQPTE